MKYLQTRSGLIRAGAIDRFEKKTYRQSHLDGTHTPHVEYIVGYHIGASEYETRADEAAVEEFLS